MLRFAFPVHAHWPVGAFALLRGMVVLLVSVCVLGSGSGASWAQQNAGKQAGGANRPGGPTPAEIAECIKRAQGACRAGILNNGYPPAVQVLAAMALTKSGVPADDPAIKKVVTAVLASVSDGKYTPGEFHQYEAAIALILLANTDPVKHKPAIQAITDYFLALQSRTGFWDYPAERATAGDTSICQYVLLGLWEARRAGVEVPLEVFERVANWHYRIQSPDGGFCYHPAEGLHSTPTMTAAGICSLVITRINLYGVDKDLEGESEAALQAAKKFGVLESAEVDAVAEEPKLNTKAGAPSVASTRALGRALQWMDTRFIIEPGTQWLHYYLYTIERIGALTGRSKFGGRDWYLEGAAILVRTQGPDGNWGAEHTPSTGAPFGLLFLSKPTAKMVKKTDKTFGAGLLVGGRGLPTNLKDLRVGPSGKVEVQKMEAPLDQLLSELENAQSQKVEAAQAALVETLLTEKPEMLIKQRDRLLKLAVDPRPDVRRTAYWALGRTNDLRIVPLLLEGLQDPDGDCVIEARNALRYISKRVNDVDPPDTFTPEQRAAALTRWRRWYHSVRPYDERDDIFEVR